MVIGNGLVSENMYSNFRTLSSYGFKMNRLLDRQVSFIRVQFHMRNFQEFWHKQNAHIYPVAFSDMVNDYIEGFAEESVIYDETPVGDEDYENVMDCVSVARQYLFKMLKHCNNMIDDCIKESDHTSRLIIEKYIALLTKYVSMYNFIYKSMIQWGETKKDMIDYDNYIDFDGLLKTYNIKKI